MAPTVQQVLTDLAAAHIALRRSSTAFDTAMQGMQGVNDGLAAAVAGMRDTMAGIAASNHAQRDAIDAIIAATEQALQLFTAPERH